MRRTKFVVVSAWVSRLAAAFAMLLSLRMLSKWLAPDEYAGFIIIVGLTGWFALSDFGLGYATQNAVTKRSAEGEDPSVEVLSAYLLLAATTLVMLAGLYLVREPASSFLFSKVTGLESSARPDVFWHSALVLTLVASAGLSTKILYATHRGYVANIATAVGSVLGLAALSGGLPSVKEGKVAFAVLALYGPNGLLCLAFCLWQVGRALPGLSAVTPKHLQRLLRNSSSFMVFYFMAAAVLQIDYLIMSQRIVSLEIIQYYNVAKIFSFVTFFNQAILFAAWPQFTEEFARGMVGTIHDLLKRLVLSSAAVTLAATIAVLVLREQVQRFLLPDSDVVFRYSVILGFAFLALVRCLVDPFAIFLQSIGKLRLLIVFASAQALIGGILQWILSGFWGIEGILAALVISFLVTVAWGLPWATRRSLAPPNTVSI